MRIDHTIKLHLTALGLLAAFSLEPPAVWAQGSLTPPGAPAPTMKSLAQVEPHTPIASAPYTISASGSYYLTTNLSVATGDAITISASGVTLDLGGFTISSTAPSATGFGIRLNSGYSDITIVNGHIKGGVTNNGGTYNGPGFAFGIAVNGSVSPLSVRVAGVSVSGCLSRGINLDTRCATVVESCTVRTVGLYGIMATTVKDSVVIDCGDHAVFGRQVSDCWGECTGSGAGIWAYIVQNSYGYSSNYYGIHAWSVAQNCWGVSGGSGSGVMSFTAQNCYGTSSSGKGLEAVTAFNCQSASTSGTGLDAEYAENCFGWSTSGTGLDAKAALNCQGSSTSGTALYAFSALNCYGFAGSATGLDAQTAQNCYGYSASGAGLDAWVAQNCYGESGGSWPGLQALKIAIGCYGSSASSVGLSARIANSCDGTSISATYKYNMP